jgi:transcriptional regulator with XRE-family HTH domain
MSKASLPKNDKARGKRLQELRKRKGLTQLDVAHELDVEKSSVSRWESGEVFPRDHLQRLADLYECEASYIVFGKANTDDVETYPAFDEFVRWLKKSPLAPVTEPWHVEVIRSLRLPPNAPEPKLDDYRRLHMVVLEIGKK